MPEKEAIRILYMEDDPGLARLFQKKLRRAGYTVDVARNGHEGLEMYSTGRYDVVATDQSMPGHNGLEVIKLMASQGVLPPTIMITGTGSEQTAVEAMKLGASDYMVKDVDGGYLDLLPTVIERVLHQQRLIKEKQQAEQALREHAAKLEARNEELDAFAHTVAHDLKGPLAHMVGFAYLLAQDQGTVSEADQRDYLQLIARSGRRMCNIIDELLLLSSVRKVSEVELGFLDMGSVVSDVLERLKYLIEPSQATIHYPDEWPLGIGYAAWVEEVWVNYISNAIKYGGEPPHVELGATISEEGENEVRFWVRDNGSGLTPEEQSRLFTPFTRLDQTRARGHGLGLSIVRRIVDRLDGSVGVESQTGTGSTFWFTLPAVQP